MSLILLHSQADIIGQALTDLSLGSVPSYDDGTYNGGTWPVFTTNEPDLPDNCITVYDTQGRDYGRAMADGHRFEHPGIQVRVRAQTHAVGFLKARQLAEQMDLGFLQLQVVMPDDTLYTIDELSRTSDVIPLGVDNPQTKRHLFTINAVVTVEST